jgi:hypothetical protein
VTEAPPVKKRKLKRGAEPTALVVEPATPLIETATPVVKTTNVPGFLASKESSAFPLCTTSGGSMVFLVNEPVLAVLVNIVGLVEEPL